jgi:hypothetical protein
MDIKRNNSNAPLPSSWNKPLPQSLSRPTYWPSILALAVTLVLLGPVTLMPITGVGLILGAVALIGWIGEILHE